MTNKARNIYIDTTGFCENALRRVDKAIKLIVDKKYLASLVLHGGAYSCAPIKAIDNDGYPMGRYEAKEFQSCGDIINLRQVWLFELESLAGMR